MPATLAEPSGELEAGGTGAARIQVAQVKAASPSLTRGFLFADLRGYTRFVETQGATAAAELLVRYRAIVREAVARHQGAEIKTEGDGFFVVFPAVSGALLCGLAITQGAREAVEPGTHGINVGVGIHAGETVDTPDGFVGSAVNIAARICAIAGPGQVLVSDTVRALTQSIVPVSFAPLGRRPLKGVKEPLMLYVAAPADPVAAARAARRQRTVRVGRWVALAAVVVILAAGAFWWQNRPAAALPAGPWTIGLDMPLTGDAAFRGTPIRDAVKLAIQDADLGGVTTLALKEYDDAGSTPSGQDPQRGTANALAMIADPRTLAMVGPASSAVAYEIIKQTNRAGLLQCSPTNTLPELTKPDFGALKVRSANPDRINYVRMAPSDDIQGPALASFAFNDLSTRRALVIDDTDVGRDIADSFEAAYDKLGGSPIRRALNPGADPNTVLDQLSEPNGPQVVFFGGFGDAGAALRSAMDAGGHKAIPFLSWDGIFDGSGTDEGSFIQRVGASAGESYAGHASLGPPLHAFAERYRTAYGREPDEYAPAGYACTEVIIQALRGIASTGPSPDTLREALRAYTVDPTHQYKTVLGTLGFDKNGDSTQQFVTFYRVDRSAKGGAGDWVILKQQDFGPAP
jgi:ABC-type branched-subunit amino acid transport system substrate-binding protein